MQGVQKNTTFLVAFPIKIHCSSLHFAHFECTRALHHTHSSVLSVAGSLQTTQANIKLYGNIYDCCIRLTALLEYFEWTLNKP